MAEAGDGEWSVAVHDVEITLPFLIPPKVGDELELARSGLVFSILHKQVVVHVETLIKEGTLVYALKDWKERNGVYLFPDDEGVYVGTSRTQWEDSWGNVHDGAYRFLVEVAVPNGGLEILEIPLMDVDSYWGLRKPPGKLDYILTDWENSLV